MEKHGRVREDIDDKITRRIHTACWINKATDIPSEYEITSMQVPGDRGSIGKHIYVFTVESPQPVEARHHSCSPCCGKQFSCCGNPATLAGKAHIFT
jgi:hypothetical protein